ncbi:hypothetical protein D9619_009150 [Psilocybe cf. subviscida]|uniref:Uncharacterized protein n=1 Tax=Psilocybe cf. subviscida TaxID=2480587 RepID=A0A8H5BVF5_9AGAR|nr:hypothetical protein D9619_009150 [Psilocybe cf. subviscida]
MSQPGVQKCPVAISHVKASLLRRDLARLNVLSSNSLVPFLFNLTEDIPSFYTIAFSPLYNVSALGKKSLSYFQPPYEPLQNT